MSGDREARPLLQLGAPSPGGLRLPDAKASAGTLYAPRGVAFLPGGGLAVSDTGNHRVLVWRTLPSDDHTPADLVLGQPDFRAETAQANGHGPANGMHLPCGITVLDGRLFVCDAWNHRVLIWNEVPRSSSVAPDAILGQPDVDSVERNRGAAISARGLDCPYGLARVDGDLVVADTQNRRVLAWDGVPEGDAPAARVIGQDAFDRGEENRGRGVGPDTFRWPHAIVGAGGDLVVADAGNHRLVGWSAGRDRAGEADLLVGQTDFASAFEMPHVAQGPERLRFPYGLAADDDRLVVADTANNRVLVFPRQLPERGARAVSVLGQANFDAAGENRWDEIAPDSLCWPYGLALEGDLLAVADSGNNRVVVWRLPSSS
ncbi:MAG: NHL repeat-containing protein [Planctomycetota bacterium]